MANNSNLGAAKAAKNDAKTEAPKAKRPYHRKAKTTTNAKK